MNLLRRDITSDILCVQCGFYTEDGRHILLDFDFSKTAHVLLRLGNKWRRIPILNLEICFTQSSFNFITRIFLFLLYVSS